jgi:hypothetical protein
MGSFLATDRFSLERYDVVFCASCCEFVTPDLCDEEGQEFEAPICPFCSSEVIAYASLMDELSDLQRSA